ncbi:unnamed protein product [Rotaria magnacalcarata]|uniref:Apple domain-containing protein n=3 Tax=Rotaria magnacalcarata TaxID=392030 RepID=A0A815Y8E5_9BILA|nr:unnamed protein product [Rotaria magnacalcarata]
MLIFIIFQSKTKLMAWNYLENCFYEKRINTTLHGYNDLHDRWLSDFDCFDRCLRADSRNCRSFEHWHKNGYGICVRANISLTDYPLITRHNPFVDYYEIRCRQDPKTIKPSVIHCPNDQLFLTIQLNGIDPNDVLLGDRSCKTNWSNATHAQFISHINNCSLTLINDSIVGKIRWKNVHKHNHTIKQYERFFVCQPNIEQIRLMHQTSTKPTLYDDHNALIVSSNHYDIYNDEQEMMSSNRITFAWKSHNHSYLCPQSCYISLYSFINITLDDLSLISSKFLIDSCDFIALHPYANYVQSRRLIYQGCSIDPTVIQVAMNTTPSSMFHFSFYLYHILKEPIPFQIQCKILHQDDQTELQNNIDCSKVFINNNHNDHSSMHKNGKQDYSFKLFHSSKVYVTRQLPFIDSERGAFHTSTTKMKLFLLIILTFLIAANANPISRKCKCKAVSNTIHFSFHSWDISSCKFCSCNDAAMTNCEQACKTMVESYANTGCGKVIKGSKVKYSWEASTCSSGVSSVEYTCA